MLRSLQIQNFKCWKSTGVIKLAPITLLFGTNSSGKSSIGQFLLMLKQTVESPDRKAVFFPGGVNSPIQLGSFHEMVFERNTENRIVFDYRWNLPEKLRIKDPISGYSFAGDSLTFHAKIGLEGKTRLMVQEFKYQLFNRNKHDLSIGIHRNAEGNSKHVVKATNYMLQRKRGRVWRPGQPVRFYGFPDEFVAYFQNADFVQELNLEHEKLFRSIFYLGPLRNKAERLYTWSGIEPESVGFSGESTVAAILAARKRKISLGHKMRRKPFEQIIAQQLKQMGLIEDLKVNPISKQRQDYEVKIRTKGSTGWVDLPDVGFGISQVLPVLVQCFFAPRGSTIIMEQPEIHLHPSAQAALADVMIDVINSRENGEDRNIQLIIETHSEHFLRRLQRRIAESKISQEIVSTYFANTTKTPAMLEPLQIDIFGNILNWPDNFFGNEMEDITEQAKAALEKRNGQNSRKQKNTSKDYAA